MIICAATISEMILQAATIGDAHAGLGRKSVPKLTTDYATSSRVPHNGQRVVIGQRLMQSASDIFIGWSRGPAGRDFYVRQLRDMKVAADVETQPPDVMRAYAILCRLALARAHDKGGDAAMIAGYPGSIDHFDEAIGDYAVGYADRSNATMTPSSRPSAVVALRPM